MTIYRIRPAGSHWAVWRYRYSALGGLLGREPVLAGVSLERALAMLNACRQGEQARKETP